MKRKLGFGYVSVDSKRKYAINIEVAENEMDEVANQLAKMIDDRDGFFTVKSADKSMRIGTQQGNTKANASNIIAAIKDVMTRG